MKRILLLAGILLFVGVVIRHLELSAVLCPTQRFTGDVLVKLLVGC